MSREILFKAKRKNWRELTKEEWWVEGYYHHQTDYYGEKCDKHYIIDGTKTDMEGYGEHYEIDPETLCQYIGKTDRNGKKIWENDILKGFEYPFFADGDYDYFALVKWVDEWIYFCLVTVKNPKSSVRGISEGNTELFEKFDGQSWEVIGNIFDNPELLRQNGGAEWK